MINNEKTTLNTDEGLTPDDQPQDIEEVQDELYPYEGFPPNRLIDAKISEVAELMLILRKRHDTLLKAKELRKKISDPAALDEIGLWKPDKFNKDAEFIFSKEVPEHLKTLKYPISTSQYRYYLIKTSGNIKRYKIKPFKQGTE